MNHVALSADVYLSYADQNPTFKTAYELEMDLLFHFEKYTNDQN